MYLVQVGFNLSDESTEEIVYDSPAMRNFIGMDLSRDPAPDATTLLQFRHQLERQGLAAQLFATVNAQWRNRGLLMREAARRSKIKALPEGVHKTVIRDPKKIKASIPPRSSTRFTWSRTASAIARCVAAWPRIWPDCSCCS
jgi:IS5 family transposase